MISESGIWGEEEAEHHQHSEALAKFFIAYFDKETRVYDFGCGLGYYVKHLNDARFLAWGVEGAILKGCLIPSKVIQHDLTQPFTFNNRQGNVICLEVGEHIPPQFEQQFLNSITAACSCKLVMSWALPLQGGLGHVNCQPQEYIIAEVCRRGFAYKEDLTLQVRETIEDNCDWFRMTLLIFERV